MAQIIQETLLLTVSKLVRTPDNNTLISESNVQALEQVAQELLGESVVVEVERAQ